MQKAHLPTDKDISNAKNHSGDKPLWYGFKLLRAVSPKDGTHYALRNGSRPVHMVVDLRIWGPKSKNGSTVFASVWVNGNNRYISGTGKAGGYGYCKASAASAEAIRSAGITLDQSISGAGLEAVETAIYAIGLALGYKMKDLFVVRCDG